MRARSANPRSCCCTAHACRCHGDAVSCPPGRLLAPRFSRAGSAIDGQQITLLLHGGAMVAAALERSIPSSSWRAAALLVPAQRAPGALGTACCRSMAPGWRWLGPPAGWCVMSHAAGTMEGPAGECETCFSDVLRNIASGWVSGRVDVVVMLLPA